MEGESRLVVESEVEEGSELRTDASEQIRGRTEAGDLAESCCCADAARRSLPFPLRPSASNRGYGDIPKA